MTTATKTRSAEHNEKKRVAMQRVWAERAVNR